MPSKIIVGCDGSPQSDDALALGQLLAGFMGAEVLAVHVYPTHWAWSGIGYAAYLQLLERKAEHLLEDTVPAADDGVSTGLRAIPSASPARGLHTIAEEEDAALIVVGSRHCGAVGRVLPGAVGELLLRGAPCPVAIAPVEYAGRDAAQLRTVAVGYDGRAEARLALSLALDLARAGKAALRIICVNPPLPPTPAGAPDVGLTTLIPATRQAHQEVLDEASAAAEADVRCEPLLLDGEPSETLLAQTERGVDLLVLGSRGYGRARQVLLGGVSHRLAHGAACPVLIVPQGTAGESPRPMAEGVRSHRY